MNKPIYSSALWQEYDADHFNVGDPKFLFISFKGFRTVDGKTFEIYCLFKTTVVKKYRDEKGNNILELFRSQEELVRRTAEILRLMKHLYMLN